MFQILAIIFVLYVLYALFVKGALFRIILGVFAFIGMRGFLLVDFPSSAHMAIVAMDWGICYATIIPAIIIILTMATTKA